MSGTVLVYGATGFSGRLVAERLRSEGCSVTIAGRDGERVRSLAATLDVPYQAVDLRDPGLMDQALAGVEVVLNAAGPFVDTAPAVIEACLRAGAHYLDLSGEWPTFALAQQRSVEAAAAGLMLMPGVGFTVVASDCLLALAAGQVPDAVLMRIAVSLPAVLSRGTLRAFLGLAGRTVIVRRDGAVRHVPVGRLRRYFNFGAGMRGSTAVSWPDVITAQHTTGVGAIETYLEAPLPLQVAFDAGAHAMKVHGEGPVRAALSSVTALWPEQPSPAAQGRAVNAVVVEAVDPWRRTTRFGVRTLDGYSVTALTATAIVEKVLAGDLRPGFQTPAGLYGHSLLGDLGCAWPYDAGPGAAPAAAPTASLTSVVATETAMR
jgi:saccharopine dehydrogenase (NAD+, L-lysine-forming)